MRTKKATTAKKTTTKKKTATRKKATRKKNTAARKSSGQTAVKSLVLDAVDLYSRKGAALTAKSLEPLIGTLAQLGDNAINQFTEQLAEKIAEKVADRMGELLAGTVAEIRFPRS